MRKGYGMTKQEAIDILVGVIATNSEEENEALDMAIEALSIDIVRCKDCKWWDKDDNYSYGYCMAMKHGYMSTNWEIGIYRKYKGDFYCADGERGEVDDES